MPSFPTYGLQTETTKPLPGVRYSPGVPSGAFGQGVGQSLQRTGAILGQRAIEMAEEDSAQKALDALHRASIAADAYLYGGDGQPGILSLEGHAALGISGPALKHIGEIGRNESAGLGGRSQRIFESRWKPRSAALHSEVSKHESGQRIAARDATVDSEKRQALRDVARNPFSDDVANEAKRNLAQTMALGGKSQIEVEDALRAVDETRENHLAVVMIRQSPLALAQELSKPDGYFSERSVGWREARISEALTEYENQERQKRLAEEHQSKAEEQAEKVLRSETWKTGVDLMRGERLSAGWLEANRDNLSDDDYKTLSLWLVNGPPTSTNPSVYASLRALVGTGEFVEDEIRIALLNGELTIGDRDKLIAASQDVRFKAGRDFLERYTKIGLDPVKSARAADAVLEMDEWIFDNPEASREEVITEARQIARRALLFDAEGVGAIHLKPRFLVRADSGEPDLQATVDATRTYYLDRNGGDMEAMERDPDFRIEAERIGALSISLEAVRALDSISGAK